MNVPKREVNQLLEKLHRIELILSEHEFFDLADRRMINQMLSKDLEPAIAIADYLESIAE